MNIAKFWNNMEEKNPNFHRQMNEYIDYGILV